MELYGFWRSSATYRVRIALGLKGLACDTVPIDLLGGAQHAEAWRARNPQALVPALDTDDGLITQSLAILEYLEEAHPSPALLPPDRAGRARVRALTLAVACEMQPLNNLRVERYLRRTLHLDDVQIDAWRHRWVIEGLDAFERALDHPSTGRFCHGDTPTFADCCLVPQVYNAIRWGLVPSTWPRLGAIYDTCMSVGAFQNAAPEAQPDAPA